MKFLKGIGGFLITYLGYVLTITIGGGGYLTINDKKYYFLTTAIASGDAATAPDATTAAVGSFAFTTHATGRGQVFYSDGTYWLDYNLEVLSAQMATIATTGNTDIYFISPCAGKLSAAMFSSLAALATNDTNYITFSLVNLGQAGAGTNDLLAASDANTTKATGGTAISANTRRNLTKHGTAGNLVVARGDRLRFRAAATETLAGAVTAPVVELLIEKTV